MIDEIREVAKQYPESKSAILPALRIAQERYGWLSREAFESELGVSPGQTTSDGAVTLRAVECLGGCSTPTIVAVDHRYRQSVAPGDVPAILEELRNG